ncbi:MAG TPA: hypothetical protein DDZ80_18585 [Cyanobacteria bacterium UBA8803]|nr:hypothetical protein [Cyanobacteria bacterium UBA9273]HBL60386.1 hypothetical protein [Cyanobacteria bacterium UBA8803]
MHISIFAGTADNSSSDGRWFLFEVVGLGQKAQIGQIGYPIRQSSSMWLAVPYSRMNQTIRRIARLGGKIVSVKPMTADSQTPSPLAWWVEISTTEPAVIYYFGPFDSLEEAKSSQGGYIEDLQAEDAQGIAVDIKWCRPDNLTIF